MNGLSIFALKIIRHCSQFFTLSYENLQHLTNFLNSTGTSNQAKSNYRTGAASFFDYCSCSRRSAYPVEERGLGVRTLSLRNHKAIGLLSNTGPDLLKQSQSYHARFNIEPSSAHQRNAISINSGIWILSPLFN